MLIQSSRQTISSSHIEGTTLGADEEIFEFPGIASGVDLEGVGGVGGRQD